VPHYLDVNVAIVSCYICPWLFLMAFPSGNLAAESVLQERNNGVSRPRRPMTLSDLRPLEQPCPGKVLRSGPDRWTMTLSADGMVELGIVLKRLYPP
jgi:hypothetical protein